MITCSYDAHHYFIVRKNEVREDEFYLKVLADKFINII